MNKNIVGIESEAMDTLLNYHWPGNVRELENAIERAMVVGIKENITFNDLRYQFNNLTGKPPGDSLADIEKTHIQKILQSMDWNISRSAGLLKIDRVTLYNKIKKYKLKQ